MLVEYPQYSIFTMDAGHDGDAEIHVPFVDRQLYPPVLGNSAFGDVEFGQDFDAGEHLLGSFNPRQGLDRIEHPIQAVTDLQASGG